MRFTNEFETGFGLGYDFLNIVFGYEYIKKLPHRAIKK